MTPGHKKSTVTTTRPGHPLIMIKVPKNYSGSGAFNVRDAQKRGSIHGAASDLATN